MPPFKKVSEAGPRAKLREAVEAAMMAETAVHDLEIVETASFERKMEAEDKLAELKERREHQDDGAADAFIASMRAGGDCLVDALDAAARTRAQEIEAKEREVAMLAHVRTEIAERIPVARQAADDAKRKVADLANEFSPPRWTRTPSSPRPSTPISSSPPRRRGSGSRRRSCRSNRRTANALAFGRRRTFATSASTDDHRRDPANADLVAVYEALVHGDVNAIDLAP